MSLKSAAYPKVPGGPLDVDKKFYTAVVEAPRVPVETIEVPIRSGRAWSM